MVTLILAHTDDVFVGKRNVFVCLKRNASETVLSGTYQLHLDNGISAETCYFCSNGCRSADETRQEISREEAPGRVIGAKTL